MKYPFQMSGLELEALVAAGDPEAALLFSRWLLLGWRGVAQDERRAMELLQHTASLGYPRAMRLLGDHFSRGDGVSEDHARAETWWRNAAKAGDLDAMTNLVPLMKSNDPQRQTEGRHWAQTAAQLGAPDAQRILGVPPVDAGTPVHWTIENVTATPQQMSDLVGLWLELLRPYWPHVRATTEIEDADVDFPCPAAAALPGGTLEVTVLSGPRHLQLDLTQGDEGWTLSLTSFEPHPTQEEAPWVVGELRHIGAQLGLTL